MPHFSPSGRDTYICQVCGTVRDDCPTWRPDITGRAGAGNVCPSCLEKRTHGIVALAVHAREHQQISLTEHCRRESGLTDGPELTAYINRYYGHG